MSDIGAPWWSQTMSRSLSLRREQVVDRSVEAAPGTQPPLARAAGCIDHSDRGPSRSKVALVIPKRSDR